jgi:tRNA(Ile)-lysidine synthase
MHDSDDPILPEERDRLFARFTSHMPCALAVSGGSDSTALAVLFADWLRQTGQDPAQHTVVSVNHGLRPESKDETWQVHELALRLGYRSETILVLWDGDRPRTGVQAAARDKRYRLFDSYMRQHHIALLLTGHTLDDQAETLLMRLARGSGLDGLSAMAPISRLEESGAGGTDADVSAPRWIGRPFLNVPKARLRATLKARGVAWIEDPSNRAPEFERSRLRAARPHLDALRLTDAMLALSARRLLRVRRALDRVVERFCDPEAGAVRVEACGVVAIDRDRLREAGEEIALRVLDAAVVAAGGCSEPVPLSRLEAIAGAICGGTAPSRWTLARALITAEEPTVTVEREPGREQLPALTVAPGTTALWDGRFRVRVAPGACEAPLAVCALGAAALRDLRRRGAIAADAPAGAATKVPSVWREAALLAVPPLGFWQPPLDRAAIDATFVGMAGIGAHRPRWR